jgi:hypothetical protein
MPRCCLLPCISANQEKENQSRNAMNNIFCCLCFKKTPTSKKLVFFNGRAEPRVCRNSGGQNLLHIAQDDVRIDKHSV